MIKVFKKVFMITLTLLITFVLVACNQKSLISKAKNQLEIELNENISLDEIKTNITLPTEITIDNEIFTVTWESNDASVISINGLVTRKEVNVTITLTATIKSKNNEKDTKRFNLVVIADDSTKNETLALINEDIENIDISLEDLRVILPTKGTVNESNITWSIKSNNITSKGYIIPNNVIENSNIGKATATFTLNGYYVVKDFEFEIPTQENHDIVNVKTLPYTNLTNEYEVESDSLELYFDDNYVIPYVSIIDFVEFLKGYIDSSITFNASLIDGVLELSYEYYYEEENKTYEFILTIDTILDTIKTNDSNFFSGFLKGTKTNYSRNINYLEEDSRSHYVESNGYNLNLADYGFNMVQFEDKILVPFYIANFLFNNTNYFSIYYNYNALYGTYFIPSEKSELDLILKSTKNNALANENLLIHNLNFLAFFFDNFYGLKEYKNVETYYTSLLRNKEQFLNTTVKSVDDTLFKYLNTTIDEMHTYYGIKSYYQSFNARGPELTSIAQLGTHNTNYYYGLFDVDDSIAAKWNVPSSYSGYAAYYETRQDYWTIDNNILVVTFDSFDTSDIYESNTFDNNLINELLKHEIVLPSIDKDRFIYFNNSDLELDLVEILIKDASSNDLLHYQNSLLNSGFTHVTSQSNEIYKVNGYYTKLFNGKNIMVQLEFDDYYEVLYVGISTQTPENTDQEWPFYVDIESLVLSDSAIYLELTIEKALKEYPNIKNAILDITWNSGGNIGALYRVIGLLFNKPFTTSMYDPHLKEYSTNVVEINNPVSFEFLNWYILQSSVTFSAANLLSTIVKSNNLAPIIGQKSGGGAASVVPIYTPIGSVFASSSSNVLAYVLGDNTEESPYEYMINEGGIEPDFILHASNLFSNTYLKNIVYSN